MIMKYICLTREFTQVKVNFMDNTFFFQHFLFKTYAFSIFAIFGKIESGYKRSGP